MEGENNTQKMDQDMEKKDLTLEEQFSPDSMEKDADCSLVVLKDVFNYDSAKILSKEVLNLKYVYSLNDLHSINQSEDFSTIDDLPRLCRQFLEFMKSPAMRSVLLKTLSVDEISHVTMTASAYDQNDYLLCHDDRVGTRAVAFVYYLTDNWDPNDGGHLQFFKYDKCTKEPIMDSFKKKVVPVFNSMVLFRVNKSSYHEVEQVYGDKPRVSINGWFHSDIYSLLASASSPGPSNSSDHPKMFVKAPIFTFTENEPDILCKDVLGPKFGTREWRLIAEELYFHARMFARDILNPAFFEEVAKELRLCNNWTMMGPPFRRKYETLAVINGDNGMYADDINAIKLNDFLNFLRSDSWLKLLGQLTNLDFAVFEERVVPPTCIVEVQKWRTGDYIAMADNDVVKIQPSVEVSFFFNVAMKINILGDAKNGLIHILKVDEATTKRTLEAIASIKRKCAVRRVKTQIQKNQSKRAAKRGHQKKVPAPVRLTKEMMKKINESVDRKMERIKEYRTSRMEDEWEYIMPADNSIFICMNSKNTSKYTSYLFKNHEGDNSIKYYCVNVTYFTVQSFDE